jgi:hypothetical protein
MAYCGVRGREQLRFPDLIGGADLILRARSLWFVDCRAPQRIVRNFLRARMASDLFAGFAAAKWQANAFYWERRRLAWKTTSALMH